MFSETALSQNSITIVAVRSKLLVRGGGCKGDSVVAFPKQRLY